MCACASFEKFHLFSADLTRMREILDLDLTQRDVLSPDGASPLMYAAMQGRLDIAQLLVEKGCDIDKQVCGGFPFCKYSGL